MDTHNQEPAAILAADAAHLGDDIDAAFKAMSTDPEMLDGTPSMTRRVQLLTKYVRQAERSRMRRRHPSAQPPHGPADTTTAVSAAD